MEFADADKLLDPGPLPLETGIQRLPSGVLCVAARTHMLDCKGKMFEWWSASLPTTSNTGGGIPATTSHPNGGKPALIPTSASWREEREHGRDNEEALVAAIKRANG